MRDLTHLLNAIESGDSQAAEELLPLVYDELRRLAAHLLADERGEQTLQPTALVHEAWLRIAGADERTWQGRHHFLATAAESMRRILVDRARRRLAAKRGGGAERVAADEIDILAPAPDEHLLALNEALERLAAADTRKASLVKMRYFVGLSFEEAAEACRLSSDHGFSLAPMSLPKIEASKSGYGSIFGAKSRAIVLSQNPCAPFLHHFHLLPVADLLFRANHKRMTPHPQSFPPQRLALELVML